MIISPKKTISEIQEEFNIRFPYLKLEFYSEAHKTGEGSPKKKQVSSSLTVSEAGDTKKRGDFTIYEKMQVCELEQEFERIFGLHVQVFRKSGSLWLQTISTDDWTINEQNEHGMQSIRKESL